MLCSLINDPSVRKPVFACYVDVNSWNTVKFETVQAS